MFFPNLLNNENMMIQLKDLKEITGRFQINKTFDKTEPMSTNLTYNWVPNISTVCDPLSQ